MDYAAGKYWAQLGTRLRTGGSGLAWPAAQMVKIVSIVGESFGKNL